MADFGLDLGGFSLGGGDTPNIGESIPSGGFSFGGSSIPSPTSGFNFGTGSLDSYGVPLGSPAPMPDSGGGGWLGNLMGGLGKAIDPIASAAKTIAPIAGLGTAGLSAANSIMGMRQAGQGREAQKQALGTQRDISRAALPAATNLTEAGATAMLGGPLPPGIQAQVDDFKRKSMAEINQYLAHAGIADSTMMQQWQMYVDQQATLYGQQLAQGLYGQGLQGLGVAGQGASALNSTATNMNAGVPSSISDANKALAQLAAQA